MNPMTSNLTFYCYKSISNNVPFFTFNIEFLTYRKYSIHFCNHWEELNCTGSSVPLYLENKRGFRPRLIWSEEFFIFFLVWDSHPWIYDSYILNTLYILNNKILAHSLRFFIYSGSVRWAIQNYHLQKKCCVMILHLLT